MTKKLGKQGKCCDSLHQVSDLKCFRKKDTPKKDGLRDVTQEEYERQSQADLSDGQWAFI